MNSAAWAGDPLLWTIKQRKFLKEEKERKGKVKEKESTFGLQYRYKYQGPVLGGRTQNFVLRKEPLKG